MIPRSINCLSASLIVFVLIVNLSLVPIDATKLSSNETSSTSSSTATTIDLDQSQSSQKDSMLDVSGDPIRLQSHSSTMDYQSVPHQQQSTSSAHSNDLSSMTSHAKQQHHHHHHHQQPKQMTVTYQGAPFNANQPISLKPGQFTLVSNQQIGPGHVSMIGYTIPIIKIGGIVKAEQVAQSSSPSSSSPSAAAAAASPLNPSSSSSIRMPSIFSQAGAMSTRFFSQSGLNGHSQLINHQVKTPQDVSSSSLIRGGTHSSIVQEPSQIESSISSSHTSPVASASASVDVPMKSYYEKPPVHGYSPQLYTQEQSRPLAAYRLVTDPGSSSHSQLKMSVPSATSDGQQILSSYSTPLDKPKPFVVYKPGYLEKIKQNQASFQPGSPQLMFSHSPLINQAPIQQITQPMLKTATLGQAKLQIEKNGHGLNNLVPISDFESNEITSRQLQSLIRGVSGGNGDDERFPIPHQIVEPSHLTPARPITINKQLTLDTLAQQRGQLLSSQLRQPTSATQPMMIYGTQQAHQTLPVRQAQVYQQPKMFARQIEQPQMQFAPMLSHHQKPQLLQQHEQSARMRLIDQEGSSIQIPQPQLSSSIQMPESNQKIDPKRELQEQINFVLQNSPNLSENSRGKHRNEVIRAVQESMSELDSSNGQRSNHGQYGSVDSLVPSSYASHQYRSESNEGQRQPKLAILDNTNSQYKPQQLMSTSQFAPESSAYSRYNQESTMFLPSPGQPQSNLNLIPQSKVQGTTSDTASNAALQSQYKTNLHQEIQRYLQEQMQKSTGTPVNFVSGSGGSIYTLSNQHNPMMKYNQQSSEIVEKVLSEQTQHPHSMLLNAPGQQVESAEKPNHFMLARQTELIQSQSSQQSTSTVNAPSDSKSSTTNVASSSSSSKSMNLESQLANSATSSANIQPESAKTLRGYNQWWKETAVANIQPMVPIYGTFYQ